MQQALSILRALVDYSNLYKQKEQTKKFNDMLNQYVRYAPQDSLQGGPGGR